MAFTKDLFNKTSTVYSGITSRSFSKLCGKSEGYISSILAQNLEMSNSAIVCLMESFEERKTRLVQLGASNKQLTRITELQSMMADEIAKRNHLCSTNQNMKVRHMVMEAISNLADDEIGGRSAMPILVV